MPKVQVKSQNSKVKIVRSTSSGQESQKSKVAAKIMAKPAVKAVAKESSMSLPVYALDGSKKGTVALSKEIFGAAPNEKLMAQAVRVYLVNQRQGTASTKTRGDVTGSTRKIYRQKGTGRARHGAIKAPIFVGGGIAFGPHPRNFELKMSKQMRRKALFSALSQQLAKEKVFAFDGGASTGKTKEVYGLFKKLSMLSANKKANKVLFVANEARVVNTARNIEGTNIMPAQNLNTYEVLNSNFIVFEKGAIEIAEKTFLKA